MGKYFGREPRYSREELERQAQEAIDIAVARGRPPAEDWLPLEARMAEIDRALAARPPAPEPQPMRIHEVRLPKAKAPAPAPQPEPARPRDRRPVTATQSAD